MKSFKNKIVLSMLVVMMVVFNGCINIIEEISFNKDGSGSYALTFDLSAMMSMLKDMDLGDMLNEGEAVEEEGDGEDVVKEERKPTVIDSVINFGDLIAERGEGMEIENPAFWKKVNMRLNMNEPNGVFEMTMFFDFKKTKEIAYFNENLSKLGDGNSDVSGSEMGGVLKMMTVGFMQSKDKISFKKRKFSRKVTKNDKSDEKLDDEAQQQQDMMKMMMATATWKTIYNFPRKVKSVKNNNAQISKDGKTVTTTLNLMEMMDGNADMADEIKLKRR